MERKVITKTSLVEDMENGLDRTQIQEKYGLTKSGLQEGLKIFKLKFKRAKKVSQFQFVDDTITEYYPNDGECPQAECDPESTCCQESIEPEMTQEELDSIASQYPEETKVIFGLI